MNEEARVSRAAEFYSVESDFDKQLVLYRFDSLKPLLHGKVCLELGPGSGVMTTMLSGEFEKLTVVEGSQQLIDSLPDLPNVEKHCSLFEEFDPVEKFDSIIIEHVLEHVDDPVGLLVKAQSWLAPNGKMFVGVPNADSIHRQVAVHMSMLENVTDLNQRDIDFGHRRVYTKQSLEKEILESGLQVNDFKGVFFKPLANGQINDGWTKEMWEGFYKLGNDYPELCAEILFVCSLPE